MAGCFLTLVSVNVRVRMCGGKDITGLGCSSVVFCLACPIIGGSKRKFPKLPCTHSPILEQWNLEVAFRKLYILSWKVSITSHSFINRYIFQDLIYLKPNLKQTKTPSRLKCHCFPSIFTISRHPCVYFMEGTGAIRGPHPQVPTT